MTGCNVRSKNKNNGPETIKTLFKTPNNKALFEKWKRNIPRGGVDLIPGCLVCEIHFPEESIVRYIETSMLDGTVCVIKRTKPALKPGAVPTIFPNLPPHLYRTLKRVAPPACVPDVEKKKRTSASQTIESSNVLIEKSESTLTPSFKIIAGNDSLVNDSEVSSSEHGFVACIISQTNSHTENNVSSSTQDYSVKKVSSTQLQPEILRNNPSCEVFNGEIMKSSNKKLVKSTKEKTTAKENIREECFVPDTTENFQIIIAEGEGSDSANNNETLTFRCLKDNIEDVQVPTWHWSCSFLRNCIAFLDWGPHFQMRKKVIVNYDMKYKVFVMDKEISIEGFEEPKSFQDLQNFLQIVDKITVCQGIENGEEKQWSKNCFGFVPPRKEGTKKILKKRCDECVLGMKNAPSAQKRDEEKRLKCIQRLSNALSAEKVKNRGLTLMIQRFRQRLEKLNKRQKASKEGSKSLELLEFSKKMHKILGGDVNEENKEQTESVVEESVVYLDEELFTV